MSQQKAKPVKGTAKRTKIDRRLWTIDQPTKDQRKEDLPQRTGYAALHIPWIENEDVSWCGQVMMVWTHLICFPKRKDSASKLISLRVCGNCIRHSNWYYKFTD